MTYTAADAVINDSPVLIDTAWHLTEQNFEAMMKLGSALVSVGVFNLMATLLLVGVVLALVFVVSIRRV